MNNSSVHYCNIDWIRAISSIAVVALHYHAIPVNQIADTASTGSLINGYILRLAVPLFMLVSIFLFTSKERNSQYLTQKIKQLLFFALIWPVFFYVLNGGLLSYVKKIIDVTKEIKDSPLLLFYYFFTDMETVFYFFISLPVVLVVALLLQSRTTEFIIGALMLSILAIAVLPFMSQGSLATFYNPINFIPYAPIAILINRYRKLIMIKKTRIGLLLLLIGCLLIIVEVNIDKLITINLIDGYTKNSLVALSTGVLLISLSTDKTNRLIAFMSKHSLPLYLFHTCLYALVGTICNIFFTKLLHIPATYNHMYAWLIAVVLCYLISRFIAPRMLIPSIYTG